MRIILLVLAFTLTGCASIPGMPGHLTTTVSTYDDSRSVSMKPAFLLTRSGDVAMSFGMYWNDKMKDDTVILTVVLVKYVSISNEHSLNFNVDNESFSFKSVDRFTTFDRQPSIVHGNTVIPGVSHSSKRYIVPVSFINKINTAKSVRVRVELLTSYAEANYIWSAPSSVKSNVVNFMSKIRS